MENRKRYTAIVLAAGSGRRMQSDTPKQFMELCGHPLVYYSLYAFDVSAGKGGAAVRGAGRGTGPQWTV